jgi:methionine--tRNA ligase beta chain
MKKDVISFPDFIKTDIRIGLVTAAIRVEGSSKLLELTVDLGEDYGSVTIFTGMQKWFTPEDFIGKKFLFAANLEPRKMMGKESQGMIMAADEDGSPKLIEISSEYKAGLPLM